LAAQKKESLNDTGEEKVNLKTGRHIRQRLGKESFYNDGD